MSVSKSNRKLIIGSMTLYFLLTAVNIGFHLKDSNRSASPEVSNSNPAPLSNAKMSSEIFQSMFYATADHLDKVEVEKETGYIYAFTEPGTDRAFYYKPEHTYRQVPMAINVYIEGDIPGKIVETNTGSFIVEVENPEHIYSGLSGKRVFSESDDSVLGFVSEMTKDIKIKCLTTY